MPCCLSDPNGDLDPGLNGQNYASSASYCNHETAEDLSDLISFSLFHYMPAAQLTAEMSFPTY